MAKGEKLNKCKKYIVRGGFVRSKNDGQIHFVSAREVARLYNVSNEACIFPKEHELDSEIQKGFTNKLILLRPRNDGKYQLKEVKMISEEAKRFIEGLNKLSQETGLYIYGCGCCNSPRLDKMNKPMTDNSGYAFSSEDDDNSQIEFFEDLSDKI